MIAVVFELEPAEGRADDYFDLAGKLRPLLETIDGFISIERFESIAVPGRYLSLSFFETEAAVQAWRNMAEHRAAQSAGRADILQNYRLRVATVVRDYGKAARAEAPPDSRLVHDPDTAG
ncbi:MAG: antibiotic biosynthesis monooxygenase [Hyphomonadaceae bacterium BRH_c29]|nr:MAG: antibiotic biosynthesis monooxygenase [Hyphomonadaceae bacterium BRH_c29]